MDPGRKGRTLTRAFDAVADADGLTVFEVLAVAFADTGIVVVGEVRHFGLALYYLGVGIEFGWLLDGFI